MADNVGYTPGSGAIVAADDIGGVLHQRVKLALGADGTNDGDLSASNPMPVTGSVSVTTATPLDVTASTPLEVTASTPLDVDVTNVVEATIPNGELIEALEAKMRYNKTRSHRHGGKKACRKQCRPFRCTAPWWW